MTVDGNSVPLMPADLRTSAPPPERRPPGQGDGPPLALSRSEPAPSAASTWRRTVLRPSCTSSAILRGTVATSRYNGSIPASQSWGAALPGGPWFLAGDKQGIDPRRSTCLDEGYWRGYSDAQEYRNSRSALRNDLLSFVPGPGDVIMVEESTLAETTVFDIGFTERPPWWESLILAIQNIPAMTGMFLFPGLIGASFHLAPAVIAGLYGATFVTCGLVTFLQGTFLLRLPIVMGPWAATYVVIVAGGHAFGLGAAYGSFFVAALIWVLLSLPIAGGALAGWLARVFRDPIVFGGLIVIAMAYLSTISLSNLVGTPAQVGFGAANWVGGAVCIVIIFLALLFGRGLLRRGAVVLGIIGGTLAYAIFKPIPLSRLAASEWFYVPHPFQFGFSVQPLLVFFFFLMLTASASSTLSLYHLVTRWGNDDPSNTRMSAGIFSSSVGAAIAAVLGGLSTNAYPDNIGILKSTRIGSVFVTSLAGLILLLLGFVLKF